MMLVIDPTPIDFCNEDVTLDGYVSLLRLSRGYQPSHMCQTIVEVIFMEPTSIYHSFVNRSRVKRRAEVASQFRASSRSSMQYFVRTINLDMMVGIQASRTVFSPLTAMMDITFGARGFDDCVFVFDGIDGPIASAADLVPRILAFPTVGFSVLANIMILPIPGALVKYSICALGAGAGVAVGVPHAIAANAAFQRKMRVGNSLVSLLAATENDDIAAADNALRRAARHLRADTAQIQHMAWVLKHFSEPLDVHRAANVLKRAKAGTQLTAAALAEVALDRMGARHRLQIVRAYSQLSCQGLEIMRRYGPAFSMSSDGGAHCLQSIATTPETEMACHAESLCASLAIGTAQPQNIANGNESARGYYAAAATNLENVMDTRHIDRVQFAIAHLMSMNLQLKTHKKVFDEIKKSAYKKNDVLAKKRGNATEKQHLLRALFGSRVSGDYSLALEANEQYELYALSPTSTIGMADLVCLVVGAIDAYRVANNDTQTQIDKSLMHTGLSMALAQCIEDDGHRVCCAGITRRLITVLQGFYPKIVIDVPPVGLLLSQLAQEFSTKYDRELGHVTDQEILRFVQAAKQRAMEVYRDDGQSLSSFCCQLDSYVKTTFSD